MILTCPDCSTRYSVEPSSLGRFGRTVRCVNCGTRWTAQPPDDAPQAVELAAPDPLAAPRRPGASVKAAERRSGSNLVTGLLAVLVVLLIAGGIVARDEIAARFPASVALFQKIGLPVALPLALQFENVNSSRVSERGISILTVKGEVVNLAGQNRAVPPIRITLLDGGGRKLQHELVAAERAVLEPGSRTEFSGRVVNPAEQARNFSITFDLD